MAALWGIPQTQHRDQGPAGGCVVGRLRAGDPLDEDQGGQEARDNGDHQGKETGSGSRMTPIGNRDDSRPMTTAKSSQKRLHQIFTDLTMPL